MKKFTLSQSIISIFFISTLSMPIYIKSMEEERVFSAQKQTAVNRLIADFKETWQLYKSAKQGMASPDELKKLQDRMKKIKKALIALGAITALSAAMFGTHRLMYKHGKQVGIQEERTRQEQENEQLRVQLEKSQLIEKVSNVLSNITTGNFRQWSNFFELIEQGAPIDTKDRQGQTALHKAVLFDYPEIVEILLGERQPKIHRRTFELPEKAQANVVDDEGYTPLDYAYKYGRNNALKELLKSHGGTTSKISDL